MYITYTTTPSVKQLLFTAWFGKCHTDASCFFFSRKTNLERDRVGFSQQFTKNLLSSPSFIFVDDSKIRPNSRVRLTRRGFFVTFHKSLKNIFFPTAVWEIDVCEKSSKKCYFTTAGHFSFLNEKICGGCGGRPLNGYFPTSTIYVYIKYPSGLVYGGNVSTTSSFFAIYHRRNVSPLPLLSSRAQS